MPSQVCEPHSTSREGSCFVKLELLHGFVLSLAGTGVELPLSAQRVMAFLALHQRPLLRTYVASTLWMDSPEHRAAASLRSALWRLKRAGQPLVATTTRHVQLNPAISVDIRDMAHIAHAVLDQRQAHDEVGTLEVALCGDFLPDWTDDWVIIERERFRQLRLHALEALCEQLTSAHRYGQAVQFGLAAVAGEPLRESAHRVVIKAYLAEGNRCEALRQYETYRRLAHDELEVEPSPGIKALVERIGTADRP